MLTSPSLDALVYELALDMYGDGTFARRALMDAAKQRVTELGEWKPDDDEPSQSPDRKSVGLANIDWSITRLFKGHLLQKVRRHGFWRVSFGDVPESDDETTRRALIEARRGQGKFREGCLEVWESRCCVTGFALVTTLVASHIKPWRVSTNTERLDRFNGLLLSPSYNALFDAGFVTFQEEGSVLFSVGLCPLNPGVIGVSRSACIHGLTAQHRTYLTYHREKVFQG